MLEPYGKPRYNPDMGQVPIVVITGAPEWTDRVERIVEAAGFAMAIYHSQAGYVVRLADDHAALVIVDGDQPGWEFWVSTPKASPATRRVPVVVVSVSAARRRAGLDAGADFALPLDFLHTELPVILRQHSRIQDSSARAHLEARCHDALPPQAREAIAQFNAGHYYTQHDLLEELWMEEQGAVRDLYRAVLQVGISYYQVTRGNRRGALKMLLRSIQWLNILPDECQGVDIRRLREDALRVRSALEALDNDGDMASFDLSLLRPVRLIEET